MRDGRADVDQRLSSLVGDARASTLRRSTLASAPADLVLVGVFCSRGGHKS
jgi:hypothetical protein